MEEGEGPQVAEERKRGRERERERVCVRKEREREKKKKSLIGRRHAPFCLFVWLVGWFVGGGLGKVPPLFISGWANCL